MLDASAPHARIPVYLLTGYLGSGKTTLLASWLKSPALAKSALIINELGEVGLDQYALRGMVERAALLANACICCSGLPGLEDALADLFWSRLQRRIEPFSAVMIETTGLADPLPIMEVFRRDALLRERYRLAGVVTTLSATSGLQVLASYDEAMSQVRVANLVIITKIDVAPAADVAALQAAVQGLNPTAGLAVSAQASLQAQTLLTLLAAHPLDGNVHGMSMPLPSHDHTQHGVNEGEHHGAQTLFLSLPRPLKRQTLWQQLDHWIDRHGASLLRIKGLVQINDGSQITVQWSLGDVHAVMSPCSTTPDQLYTPVVTPGLTVIAKKEFDRAAVPGLQRAIDRSA